VAAPPSQASPEFTKEELDALEFRRMRGRSMDMSSPPSIPEGIEISVFRHCKKDYFYQNVAIAQAFKEHKGSIRCLACSNQSDFVASGGEDGLIVLYGFTGNLSLLRRWVGHMADVTCLTFTTDNLVISSSLDRTVRLWHPSHPKELFVFQHEEAVTAVASHPTDSSLFLACTFGNSVLLWSIRSNEVVKQVSFGITPTAAAFSPDGRAMAVGTLNGFCYVYRLPEFRYVTQFIAGPRHKKKTSHKKVTSIIFPSSSQFLISTNDSRIRLYSTDNFSVIRKFRGHVSVDACQRACVSQDKKLLMCGSEEDGGVFIWPIEHEPHFRGSVMHGFSRERSKTCEGFFLGKEKTVSAAIFTGDCDMEHLSVVTGDEDGNLFLILSS
jgi:WD40 repeat protein